VSFEQHEEGSFINFFAMKEREKKLKSRCTLFPHNSPSLCCNFLINYENSTPDSGGQAALKGRNT
jgi:hypothetical protein